LCLLLGFLLAAAGLTLRPIVAVLALAMGLCAWLGVLVTACRADLLLSPVAPALSATAGLGIGIYRRLRQREREQSLLKAAFGDYVDPLLLGMLLGKSNPSLLGLRKEVTVLFVDLVGYTRMTNALPAEESLQILRDYVQRVTTIIKAAGGRIDKIIGDGVMAVFNDPIPLDDHARVAVRVAKDIHAAVSAGKPPLKCRIGIATGDAFVGNIGQPGAKIEYTVIGATVNLASRLEGQAPVGGTLISEQTFILCAGDADFTPAEPITLKGFDEPVRAHRSVSAG
jgi:class 3 adenylate cyclase